MLCAPRPRALTPRRRLPLPPPAAPKAVDGVSILVVCKGSGTMEECSNMPGSVGIVSEVKMGGTYLISAGTHVKMQTSQDSLLVFRAMAKRA